MGRLRVEGWVEVRGDLGDLGWLIGTRPAVWRSARDFKRLKLFLEGLILMHFF